LHIFFLVLSTLLSRLTLVLVSLPLLIFLLLLPVRQDKNRLPWAFQLHTGAVLHSRPWPVSAARASPRSCLRCFQNVAMCPAPHRFSPTLRPRTSITPTPMYSAGSPSPPLENNFLGSGAYPFDRERGAPPGVGTAHANRTGSASSIGSRSSNASAPFRCGLEIYGAGVWLGNRRRRTESGGTLSRCPFSWPPLSFAFRLGSSVPKYCCSCGVNLASATPIFCSTYLTRQTV